MRPAALIGLLLSLAASLSDPVAAQERRSGRGEPGTLLWERCKDGPAGAGWDSCRFFVGVAFEFMHVTDRLILGTAEEKVCFVGTFDVDREAGMFADYLRAHPEQHGMRAIELFHRAMREAYPCAPEAVDGPS